MPPRVIAAYGLLLLSAGRGMAGEAIITKETIPLSEPWEFKLGVPSWIAGVSGRVGVRSRSVGVDVDAGTILEHLNFVASFNAEARKGRLGIYADFLYLSDQSGTPTPGLVAKVDLRVDETLVDFDLNWRLLNGPRGWLDALVGFRYISLYSKVGLQPDNRAIEKASEEFVDAAADQVEKLLDQALHGVLEGKNPTLPVPPLANGVRNKLLEVIEKARRDPELVAAIASGNQARIAAARRKVEREIARKFKRQLSRSFPLNEWWFDPYIGLRAQYNLNRVFYLKAKADVGGFNVGSRITWEAYGAVGCQITRSIYSEAGYRYLYVNYRRNGFIYDVFTRGAQVTVGVVF